MPLFYDTVSTRASLELKKGQMIQINLHQAFEYSEVWDEISHLDIGRKVEIFLLTYYK